MKCIDSLAQRINPKTGEIINDDTIINRADFIRKMFCIKEVIEYNTK